MIVIVGVDPSITACGIGAIDRDARKILHLETVRSGTDLADSERLRRIYVRICKVILGARARAVAVEEQRRVETGARARGGYNADNWKVSAVLGVAMAAAWAHGLPVFLVQPQRAKIALLGKGSGNASKAQVKAAVMRMLGGAEEAGVFSTDAADAIAVACGVSMVELARARAA